MRDKHEQTLTVTLPDRGSRDSSFLNLDAEELQASLANVEDMAQDLDFDGTISLEDMASLNANKALLDMARQGTELLQSPEIQKAMREAQKVLQDLKFGSDRI
jgi:hypothetical protein